MLTISEWQGLGREAWFGGSRYKLRADEQEYPMRCRLKQHDSS